MQNAIVVRGVGKQYRRFPAERPTSWIEAFVRGPRRWRPAGRFWALREVDLVVAPGSMVGIIGANGAGKSTLLRLVGGVGRPDEGTIATSGRVGALLELGAGFHPDLTGRENLYISAVISGLTRRQVAARLDDIVAFAELEAAIDNPMRTYSTGMQLRLGFAVAIHVDPRILLVDEVLAVGDIAFQRKCHERIADLQAAGCAIMLVSHDVSQVQALCDEVVWLRRGRVAAHGPADSVVSQYTAEMHSETRRRTPRTHPDLILPGGATLRVNENRFGSLEMEIVAVRLLDAAGQPATELHSGQPLQVHIAYRARHPRPAPRFSVTISRDDGFVCADFNTAAAGVTVPDAVGQGHISLFVERLDLTQGAYFVDVGVYEQAWAYAYDYHWHVYALHIQSAGDVVGVLAPPYQWAIEAPAEARPPH